ncbi:GntR family transcriptional regulator [Arthrobacter livingstonensis]|uniref:GntR family transcriptional regulator n=1 Tax=Arthrobacter livingstonensis TaxID=670078 RepID=A0A2V5L009_9MICC|nr:cache domain-containing protein [Arthrobacter livingstonensis]PYI64268.1 GntR family transcriptional regulator [Arthrobacter livingstonensis]
MNPTTEVVHAANALTSWINGVSTEIEKLSRNVATRLEKNLVDKSKVDKTALVGLDALTREFLTRNTFAVGAGAFFATDAVEEGSRTVEWWSRQESGAIGRLDFDLTPGSQRYYDYEKLPFFSTAATTGKQTLWGPYVDYLGFEEYVLTFAAPFSVRGTFAGVAGCDIRIKDLEPLIMPNLRGIASDAALVNASNRVILGNSGLYLVGERIKPGSPDLHRMTLDVPHLGLSLIYTT